MRGELIYQGLISSKLIRIILIFLVDKIEFKK